MKKFRSLILVLCVNFIASACATVLQVPRSIVLDGKQYTEKSPGDFISWGCRDPYDDYGRILLEVGVFSDYYTENSKPSLNGVGFILVYDGGSSGDHLTKYRGEGIDRRWDWMSNGDNFAFVIDPNGIGRYYDFRFADEDGMFKPRGVYRC